MDGDALRRALHPSAVGVPLAELLPIIEAALQHVPEVDRDELRAKLLGHLEAAANPTEAGETLLVGSAAEDLIAQAFQRAIDERTPVDDG